MALDVFKFSAIGGRLISGDEDGFDVVNVDQHGHLCLNNSCVRE